MLGGSDFEKNFGLNPSLDSLQKTALETLRSILGISRDPERIITKVHKKCIAQYTIGHLKRVENARKGLENLPVNLVGSSYDGVGLNDAIMSAKNQVLKFEQAHK